MIAEHYFIFLEKLKRLKSCKLGGKGGYRKKGKGREVLYFPSAFILQPSA